MSDEFERGRTRAGTGFSVGSRHRYTTLEDLKRAHAEIYKDTSELFILGELNFLLDIFVLLIFFFLLLPAVVSRTNRHRAMGSGSLRYNLVDLWNPKCQRCKIGDGSCKEGRNQKRFFELASDPKKVEECRNLTLLYKYPNEIFRRTLKVFSSKCHWCVCSENKVNIMVHGERPGHPGLYCKHLINLEIAGHLLDDYIKSNGVLRKRRRRKIRINEIPDWPNSCPSCTQIESRRKLTPSQEFEKNMEEVAEKLNGISLSEEK